MIHCAWSSRELYILSDCFQNLFCILAITLVANIPTSANASPLKYLHDDFRYNEVIFAGTHNSAINLGPKTPLRPDNAVSGKYPSEAHSSYHYFVMDQRLSVRDQLDMGIRVIDLEMASLQGTNWTCTNKSQTTPGAGSVCVEKNHLGKRCFEDCPFIVSHGNLVESVGLDMGFTFPETIFESVAQWVDLNPAEIVTLFLITTHGNAAPPSENILARMNSTNLLAKVWNPDFSRPFGSFPTLGEMRSSGKTVMVVAPPWGAAFSGSHCASPDIKHAGETCAGGVPCMEGWDAVVFDQLSPDRAVLSSSPPSHPDTTVFGIENLSSRRGRDDHDAEYFPLPHLAEDEPFQFGGNPAQAARAANYTHIIALESHWSSLLKPLGMTPNWILVDFFNTTTPDQKTPSRSLLPNPHEGLIRAVNHINARRWDERNSIS